MKYLFLFMTIIVVISLPLKAQTLFTYGNYKVDVKEFLRSYNKTFTSSVVNKDKNIREYLELYSNSRLKIHEALIKRFDTLSSFREELNLLRNQIIENYMNEPEALNSLLNEAFIRSQKDIQVSHIFIPYKIENNISDSNLVKLKINEAFMELKTGKKFEEVAGKYSADPAVKYNKGNLGYITVFSLPYEFETVVYKLSKGQFSSPFKSGFGYHIFKNNTERKAIGKIRLSQILIAIPPGSDATEIEKLSVLADSIYIRLKMGDDFANLSSQFNNDYISAASGGQIPEFSVGTYDPEFEELVFAINTDSVVNKPFRTTHGFHIVKRNSITPVPTEKTKAVMDDLRLLVEKDSRINITKELLYKKIISKTSIKIADINQNDLQSLADSLLDYKQINRPLSVNRETICFILGDKTKTVNDLLNYAQQNRFSGSSGIPKSLSVLLNEFKKQTAFEYYKDHLEDFNPEFKIQMNDLKEGNLFFDIMMQEVWTRAQNDTAGLRNYFNSNRNKYQWKNSADAVVFYCADENTAQQLYDEIKKDPSVWKEKSENFGDRSTVDSSRFEISKLPGMKNITPEIGLLTTIEKNNDDNSASFAYIIKLYTQTAAKSFNEARGDVISDYQDFLDKNWTEKLKKKYPVKVNEAVLRTTFK